MQTPADVQKVISAQTELLDRELASFFRQTPALPLYDHLAYFMGFKNEALQPEITYGGKRFRSSLMLMLGEWYGFETETLPFAVALELYHNFTLIHDDVVDRDTHRRGRKTVWNLFGFDHAINDGDAQLLYVAELLAAAADKTPGGSAAQAFLLKQFRTVVEGQYLDFELTKAKLSDPLVTTAAYNEMIRCKTAELIVAASVGAGLIAEQSKKELTQLEAYARNLGMAYQVCDDVVSIWATAETTGKRNYGDLKERKKTLPVLHAHERLKNEDKKRLEKFYLDEADLSDADCEEIIALLDSLNTKSTMESEISGYAEAAKVAARSLQLSEEQRDTLCVLVDSLLPKV